MRPAWAILVAIPALVLGAVVPIAPVVLAQRAAQGDAQWIAPYPQLPEYREMVGRLFTEGPPTNRRNPDITSRGVVAAGIFTPDAQAGELVASYATLTYGTINNVPNFADLSVVVQDVTQLRRVTAAVAAGIGPATAAPPGFERRTGAPTPKTQPCVDQEMVLRMFLLDARWRSVSACLETLTWSAWMPDRGEGLPPAASTAPGYRWLQRTPDVPDYREFTGRLFGEAAAANNDPRYNNLTAPAVIAIGSFRPRVRPGETFASYGVQFFNLDSNNQPDIPNLRIVVKDLTEVRFTLAGSRGVTLDIRTGTLTYRYQQCLELRVPRFMYLLDGRWRAMAQCQNLVFWAPWSGGRLLPFTGTFSPDGITTIDYAWDAAAGELTTTLR